MLVSSSDIAELVEERLPVVSTWRNRFKTGENAFPEPVGGTPARPLFDFDAVREWVSRNRPEKKLQVGLLRIRVWSALRPLSERINQFDLIYWLHQELQVRKRSLLAGIDPTKDPEAVKADDYMRGLLGSSIPDWPAEIEIIKSLVFTATTTELVEVSDFALARLSAGYGRSGGDIGAVGSSVSGILAAAATSLVTVDVGAPVIYDPACGIGETLIQTYEQLGKAGRVLGTEIDSRVATVASIRLALRDIPATIASADTLSTRQFEDLHPDLIVAEPPLGLQWVGVWNSDDPRSRFGVPPARNADLAWVEDAASRLEGSATGLVLTSMGALGNGGAEERVRGNLILRGAVKAIIALPPNLLQYTSAALALWVLRSPSQDHIGLPILIVDASNPSLGESGATKRRNWVRANIGNLMTGAAVHEGVRTASVDTEDLVAGGYNLTPARWTAAAIGEHLSVDLKDFSFQFENAIQTFRPVAPDFIHLPAAPHIVTIREMTEYPESREAKLWTGRGSSSGYSPAGMITPDHFTDLGRLTLGHRRPDDETEPGFRTEPGDVVFVFKSMNVMSKTSTRVSALVDSEGGQRLSSGVHALRLLGPSRFDPQYVALCLAGGWNVRHQAGATAKGARIGDLEIPLLELDSQRHWIEAFTMLRGAVQNAEEVVEEAGNLGAAAESFLRFGHSEGARPGLPWRPRVS